MVASHWSLALPCGAAVFVRSPTALHGCGCDWLKAAQLTKCAAQLVNWSVAQLAKCRADNKLVNRAAHLVKRAD